MKQESLWLRILSNKRALLLMGVLTFVLFIAGQWTSSKQGKQILSGINPSITTEQTLASSKSDLNNSTELMQQRQKRFLEKAQDNIWLILTIEMSLFCLLISGTILDVKIIRQIKNGNMNIWPDDGRSFMMDARWDLGAVAWGFIVLILCEWLLWFFEAALFSKEWVTQQMDVLMMINSLIRDVVIIYFVVAAVKAYGQNLSDIGLRKADFMLKQIRIGLKAYVAILPVFVLVLALVLIISKLFSYEPEPQAVVVMFMNQNAPTYIAVLTLFVATLGPIAEEIFFRGFAFKAFWARLGVWPAILISGIIFSVLHMNLAAFLPILFLGMFLAYLYARTGSLIPSMTVHMVHNILMVSLTLLFKEMSS